MTNYHLPICTCCYAVRVEPQRKHMTRPTCMACGESEARKVKHCAVPMNKSNYYYVSDMQTLTQLNPKRTT